MGAFFTGDAPRPVGLGEMGLDRFHLPKEAAEAERIFGRQRAAFAAGLRLARRLGCRWPFTHAGLSANAWR